MSGVLELTLVLPAALILERVLSSVPSLATMARLEDLDVASLDEHERVLYVQAWEKQRGFIEAHVQPALVAVAGPAPEPVDDSMATSYGINNSDDVGREEVSAALGLSPAAAQSRIDIARALQTRLRAAAQALGEGTIGFLHVRILVRETAGLTDDQARAVDERVASGQACQSLSAWSRRLRRAVRRVAPAEFEVAAAAAQAKRQVRWWPEPDGMATLSAFLPAHDAQTVWLALDALAQRDRDRWFAADERAQAGATAGTTAAPEPCSAVPTRDSLRADALVAMAQGVLADPDLPREHGRPVELRVLVSLDQLLRLREPLDGPTLDPNGDVNATTNPNATLDPVESTAILEGYGPIPAAALRELIVDAKWRRLVVDPVDGHLLDYGTATYCPPRGLVDYILARDRTCRFPGCPVAAQRCDLDHVAPFNPDRDDGGHTSSANLIALCRRHHRLKTHAGWQVILDPCGATRWTSPAGMTHLLPAMDMRAN